MASTSKLLDEELLLELECPICKEYMEAPIFLCLNGHSICLDCKSRMNNCPTCRKSFSSSRNITLENIARIIVYPCKNRDFGCLEVYKLDERDKHLRTCLCESHRCPFADLSSEDCKWEGPLSGVADHIVSVHNSPLDTFEVTGAFMLNLQKFLKTSQYRGALLMKGELFYLSCELKNDMFCCAITNLCTNDAARSFKCRFTTCSEDGEELISMCRRIRNFHKGTMSDLEPRNCITIHLETLKQFVEANGSLKCEIEFYEVGTGSINTLKKTGIEEVISSFTPRRIKMHKQQHISNVIYATRVGRRQVSAVHLRLTD